MECKAFPVTFAAAQQVADSFFIDKVSVRPRFILVIGPPGAGKSTLIEEFLEQLKVPSEQVVDVSVDAIVERIPGYAEQLRAIPLDLHDERMALYSKYRACVGDHIFNDVLERALAEHYTIVYETTARSIESTPFQMHRARQLGYHVIILYPFVPVEVSLQRVVERERKTGQVGASTSFIRDAFDKAQSNLIPLSKFADDIYLYDNTKRPATEILRLRNVFGYRGTKTIAHCPPSCLDTPVLSAMNSDLRSFFSSFCPASKSCGV